MTDSNAEGRYIIRNGEGVIVSSSAPSASDCIAWAEDARNCDDPDSFNFYEAFDTVTQTELAVFYTALAQEQYDSQQAECAAERQNERALYGGEELI